MREKTSSRSVCRRAKFSQRWCSTGRNRGRTPWRWKHVTEHPQHGPIPTTNQIQVCSVYLHSHSKILNWIYVEAAISIYSNRVTYLYERVLKCHLLEFRNDIHVWEINRCFLYNMLNVSIGDLKINTCIQSDMVKVSSKKILKKNYKYKSI